MPLAQPEQSYRCETCGVPTEHVSYSAFRDAHGHCDRPECEEKCEKCQNPEAPEFTDEEDDQ